MRRALTFALAFASAITNGFLAAPASAASQGPQVWTTNVAAGEFSSQQAAIAAVRARGGVYSLAERVERIEQSSTVTTFVYGSNPRNPELGVWRDYAMQGAISNPLESEEAAVASVKARWDLNGAVCPVKTAVIPKNDWRAISVWYSGDSQQDARDYSVEYSIPPSCSRGVTSAQASRYRTVECPQYTTWDSTQKACLAKGVAKISSRPLVCSDCELRGNPINVSTGDKYQVETDFSLPWLVFARYYHSTHSLPNARLGPGWTHSLNMQLVVTDSSNAALVTQNGTILPFRNGYEAIDGSGWRIKYVNGMYELQTPTQTLKFSAGRLVELDDLNGVVIKVMYDTLGRLTAATNSNGRSVNIEYGGAESAAAGLIYSIKADGQNLVSFDYDAGGRLVSATYRDGSARRYFYESPAYPTALTGIQDEGGNRYATYTYNEDGLAISSEHAGAVQKAGIEYQSDGATVHTNALGSIEKLTFTPPDPYRKIASSTTSAGTESWEYAPATGTGADFRRRVKSHTHRSGRIDLFTYQDLTDPVLGEVRIKRTTEASNRPEATVTEQWRRRDTNQVVKRVSGMRTQTLQYNSRGQVTRDATVTSGGESRISTYTYCDQINVQVGCPLLGLLLAVDGPMQGGADTVIFAYYPEDAPGCASGSGSCIYRKGDLWKTVRPLGGTTEVLAYSGDGRPQLVMDPNGVVTEYLYTPRGWLASTTVKGPDDASSADDRVTTFEYFPTGLVSRVKAPDGSVATYEYDAAQRLIKVGDGAGNSIVYTLDAAGNRVHESYGGPDGQVTRTQSRVYNTLGQLVTLADGLANPTDYGYDSEGNQVSVTSPLGRMTRQEYDALNRHTLTLQDVGGVGAESRFKYDVEGNVAEVTDPKGLKTTYARNGFGDVLAQISPDTGTSVFTYDGAGNVQSRTDARGVTASYTYDALGRSTSVTFVDPTADVHYVYDQPSNNCAESERHGIGRLASMIDPSGRTDYCYSSMGDLVRRVQVVDGQALTLRYAYEASGRLRSMTYPDGSFVDYGYDALGQVASIGVTPAGGGREVLLQGVKTLPFGPVSSWKFGNGRRLDRTFDKDYRPVAISDERDGLNVSFGFDPVGNITSLVDGDQQRQAATLDYDALGRVMAFRDAQTGVAIEQYSYDATGNRLSSGNSAGVKAYIYAADSHRLKSVDGVERTYDAMGNTLTIGGVWQYAYDLAGRLSGATRIGSAQSTYRHSATGQRVVQSSGAETTLHLYGEGGEWLGSYDANLIPTQQVVWLGSTAVGVIERGKVLYVEPDHLGTPRALLDPQRDEAVWSWSLTGEAFGDGSPDEDPDRDGIVQEFDLRFPGQRADSTSGLSYNYHRDYEPETGRYSQSDPIGLQGGLSTFGYALQNPLLYSDPLGLSSVGACALPANIVACQAAGIGLRGNAGNGVVQGAAGVAGAAAAAAGLKVGLDSGDPDDCGDNDDCGPDTRFVALQKAFAWAGLSIGDEGDPIPWDMYRGRGGVNYTYVRQHGGGNYGYSRGKVIKVYNHPDGHPHQVGGTHPSHHNCPHFHSTNARGEERIFNYKRGT